MYVRIFKVVSIFVFVLMSVSCSFFDGSDNRVPSDVVTTNSSLPSDSTLSDDNSTVNTNDSENGDNSLSTMTNSSSTDNTNDDKSSDSSSSTMTNSSSTDNTNDDKSSNGSSSTMTNSSSTDNTNDDKSSNSSSSTMTNSSSTDNTNDDKSSNSSSSTMTNSSSTDNTNDDKGSNSSSSTMTNSSSTDNTNDDKSSNSSSSTMTNSSSTDNTNDDKSSNSSSSTMTNSSSTDNTNDDKSNDNGDTNDVSNTSDESSNDNGDTNDVSNTSDENSNDNSDANDTNDTNNESSNDNGDTNDVSNTSDESSNDNSDANDTNDNGNTNDVSNTSDENSNDNSDANDTNDTNNESSNDNGDTGATYKGLQFNYKNLSPSEYKLEQLTDDEFNTLDESVRLRVADKLLESLFFGYPYKELKEKINQNNFLSSIKESFDRNEIDDIKLEQKILDKEYYKQYSVYQVPEVIHILTRFYEMDKLDKYYLHNWIAYILTQTIMFSPAYELSSVYEANVANVYNRLLGMLGAGNGMRYITYIHMTSEDNWRRFRSPEDNGREMLEIYLLDTNDSHVPLSAKALQNWKLNRGETLEISLNKNIEPINLFGTTIHSGDDFYRELVKSELFTYGVTRRLVDFFFPLKTDEKRDEITNKIVSSNPEKWEDILLQILFSKEYLLHNNRPLSEEEVFFSLSKKMYFKVNRGWFYTLKYQLEKAHQAPMKYKLGRLDRVPLDSLSFASYHNFIRKHILLNKAYPEETDRDSVKYDGWGYNLVSLDNFTYIENDYESTLKNYIDYLFLNFISRKPYDKEYSLLRDHFMKKDEDILRDRFNMLTRRDYDEEEYRTNHRLNITMVVLEYLSRLEDIYLQKEEK